MRYSEFKQYNQQNWFFTIQKEITIEIWQYLRSWEPSSKQNDSAIFHEGACGTLWDTSSRMRSYSNVLLPKTWGNHIFSLWGLRLKFFMLFSPLLLLITCDVHHTRTDTVPLIIWRILECMNYAVSYYVVFLYPINPPIFDPNIVHISFISSSINQCSYLTITNHI
jgi:hypothetical protein